MSNSFVRYAPDVETFEPGFDDLLEQVVAFWEKKGRESPASEGTGRAVRGAHAKTFGVVEANVEFLDDLPAEYAQGIYAEPGQHEALIRFSSTSGHLGPDATLGTGIGVGTSEGELALPFRAVALASSVSRSSRTCATKRSRPCSACRCSAPSRSRAPMSTTRNAAMTSGRCWYAVKATIG